MKLLRALKRIFVNSDRSAQLLAEIREGVANMADEVNKQGSESRMAFIDNGGRTEQLLLEIRDGIANLTDVINRRFAELEAGRGDVAAERPPRRFEEGRPFAGAGEPGQTAALWRDGSNAFYRGGD